MLVYTHKLFFHNSAHSNEKHAKRSGIFWLFFFWLGFQDSFYCMKLFLMKSGQGHFQQNGDLMCNSSFSTVYWKDFTCHVIFSLQNVKAGGGGEVRWIKMLPSYWNAAIFLPKKNTSNTFHDVGAKHLVLVTLMKHYKNTLAEEAALCLW